MLVRMLTSMAGSDHSMEFGQVVEMTLEEGTRLIDAGFAELVGVETASVEPPEKAMKRGSK